MQALFGITRPQGGTVRIEGAEVAIRSPADAVDSGIVYVPEDRGKQGAIGALPIFQNVTLPSLARTSRNGFLKLAEEFRLAREVYRAARSARRVAGHRCGQPFRRQPAEGGDRQVAGDPTEGHHP